jgi:hypothetical protein
MKWVEWQIQNLEQYRKGELFRSKNVLALEELFLN